MPGFLSVCVRLLGALALAAPLASPLHAEPEPPPVTAFFSRPQLAEAALSPSGRYLAAISGAPGRRGRLMVVDLQDSKARVVAGNDEVDVAQFEWVNDTRLLFGVRDTQGKSGNARPRGLFAVNNDGSGLRQLSERIAGPLEASQIAGRQLLSPRTAMLGQRGAMESDEAWVTLADYDNRDDPPTIALLRLNTMTGKARPVAPPGRVDRWLLDHAGEPRLTVHSADGKTRIHYLDPASGKWRLLTEFALQPGSKDAITPLGFGADGTLYVRAYAGKDTAALYGFDLASGKLGARPLVVLPGYDFDGQLIMRQGRLLGVRVETDAPADIWLDKDMKALQDSIDKLLPGTVNLIELAARADAPRVLVRSFSDLQPPVYRLYQRGTGALTPVGSSREGIDPARMARQEPLRYKARDGREIPALLTLPAGAAKKNLPLVLLVHAGPFARGNHWGWHQDSQFLAARGYAVLEPDYRGSTGYGIDHYRAGWKQWGLAMQDDIADGARWAIAQGIADPARICIAGEGYGGYAALMGLARDPALFKCGIARSALTDLRVPHLLEWYFVNPAAVEYEAFSLAQLIGDPVKDATQLKATSPIAQAARIAQPILLAHGAEDSIIPLPDVARLRDALATTNRNVEWVAYANEGHAWTLEKTDIDFWTRVERFLAKHIGSSAVQK